MEVDDASGPMPAPGQSTTDMKLDKVTAALTTQKDEIRIICTMAESLAQRSAVMEERQRKTDEAMASLQDMLTTLDLDSRVAALEVAVKAAPGVAASWLGLAALAEGGIPPIKKAQGFPVSGLAPPPRASATTSPTASPSATGQRRFVAEGAAGAVPPAVPHWGRRRKELPTQRCGRLRGADGLAQGIFGGLSPASAECPRGIRKLAM